MLLNLKTGRVAGYSEGQAPLIYLTTTVARIETANTRYVFSDGHGLATFTDWFDDPADFDKIDWKIVDQRYWADRPEDNDRQRRKQAEFLAWKTCPWEVIRTIGVYDAQMKARVESLLEKHKANHKPPVAVKREWYYY